jgi:hypothetical protein
MGKGKEERRREIGEIRARLIKKRDHKLLAAVRSKLATVGRCGE